MQQLLAKTQHPYSHQVHVFMQVCLVPQVFCTVEGPVCHYTGQVPPLTEKKEVILEFKRVVDTKQKPNQPGLFKTSCTSILHTDKFISLGRKAAMTPVIHYLKKGVPTIDTSVRVCLKLPIRHLQEIKITLSLHMDFITSILYKL